MGSGSLTVVGTGIALDAHLTTEARAELEAADVVLGLVADPVAQAWLARLNRNVRSLHRHYREGRDRALAYEAMVDEILAEVRSGKRVCAAFYGHPGIFVTPSHEALRRARDEGFPSRMLPAVSAEDCLFADLGVDPAACGCQSYEATDFLLRRRIVDATAALLLWQVGTVGRRGASGEAQPAGLPLLVESLLERYPAGHEVVVYEASPYPGIDPIARRLPLERLTAADVTALSTLYVPPLEQRPPDATALERLGLS
ncbi:MAG TPA: SAM-dependent methyltransferase [Gaiellaceae bacterium]|nr:SAM-dependent methyltransferase [Gaiellaceae bacterium]